MTTIIHINSDIFADTVSHIYYYDHVRPTEYELQHSVPS
jgi:hypothetical protein